MIYEEAIVGEYVILRSADINDAEFTLAIRQDKKYNQYLHQVENDINKQIAWIENQKEKCDSYFFIITNKKNESIGTVGLYDYINNEIELGRVLCTGNALQSIEACYLAIKFAFEKLGVNQVVSHVMSENSKSIRISSIYGIYYEKSVINEVDSGEQDTYYGKVNQEVFYSKEAEIRKILYRK